MGRGSHSALSDPLPFARLPITGRSGSLGKKGRGEEETPDVEPDEGGGGTGRCRAAAVTAVPGRVGGVTY